MHAGWPAGSIEGGEDGFRRTTLSECEGKEMLSTRLAVYLCLLVSVGPMRCPLLGLGGVPDMNQRQFSQYESSSFLSRRKEDRRRPGYSVHSFVRAAICLKRSHIRAQASEERNCYRRPVFTPGAVLSGVRHLHRRS